MGQNDVTQKRKLYEWVVTFTRGDELILTDNQFAFYKKQVKAGDFSQIFFEDAAINPPMFVEAFRRDALLIKLKYPCTKCATTGYLPDRVTVCPDCEGTGVKFPA